MLIIVCEVKQFSVVNIDILILIYLLIVIGLTPGGSSTVHIYTQTIHRTTHLTNNWEDCGPCPIFASKYVGYSGRIGLSQNHPWWTFFFKLFNVFLCYLMLGNRFLIRHQVAIIFKTNQSLKIFCIGVEEVNIYCFLFNYYIALWFDIKQVQF
jgi:hypothetical protein